MEVTVDTRSGPIRTTELAATATALCFRRIRKKDLVACFQSLRLAWPGLAWLGLA